MAVSLNGGDGDEIYRPLAEINVTPLVDVMLVLLIIFMVTAPLLAAGVKIDLPRGAAVNPIDPKPPLAISVDRDGVLYLGADKVTLEALPGAVKARIGPDETRAVHIRGDKQAAFGVVFAALDALHQAGVAHVAIVAAPSAEFKPAPPP